MIVPINDTIARVNHHTYHKYTSIWVVLMNFSSYMSCDWIQPRSIKKYNSDLSKKKKCFKMTQMSHNNIFVLQLSLKFGIFVVLF